MGDLVTTVSSSASYCQAHLMCPGTAEVAVFTVVSGPVTRFTP